jgi:hypothetical protein
MDRLIIIKGFMGICVSGVDGFHEGLPVVNCTGLQLLSSGLGVFHGVDDNLLIMNDLCLDFRSVLLDSGFNLFRLLDRSLLDVVDLCLDFGNVLLDSGRGVDNMVLDSLSAFLDVKLRLVEVIVKSLLGIIKVLQDISLDGW